MPRQPWHFAEHAPMQLPSATLNNCCRAMPRLREVGLHGPPLTEALASALASRPRIEAVHLSPSGVLDLPPEGAWEPLAQLGRRLKSLHLIVCMGALGRATDPPTRHQLPPGLLALTGLGRLDMLLIAHDTYPRTRLGGLEQTPLCTLQTDGGTPIEVWSCRQLSELHALNDPIAMPAASHGALPPLRTLELDCWQAGSRGFPAVLCRLSLLTELSLRSCNFGLNAGLPPEFSQLRWAAVGCRAGADGADAGLQGSKASKLLGSTSCCPCSFLLQHPAAPAHSGHPHGPCQHCAPGSADQPYTAGALP